MRARATVFMGLVFLLSKANAEYARPDIELVPVERIVANLEATALKEPGNAQARFNLARAHGMAFARKSSELAVRKGDAGLGPWFGYEPPFVPFGKPEAARDKESAKAAEDHLRKAIAEFGKTLEIQPDNLAAELGRAWCVEQSGDKAGAVARYRKVAEKGWTKDQKARFAPLGGHFITAEAAGYLIPLLDQEKDSGEIARLKDRVASLRRLPRPITPIAIPLKAGLEPCDLLDDNAAVPFDADGSGLSGRWTWIKPKASWLVIDRKGDGKVRSGLQLFGSVTFWMFWDNGYQPLAALDDNQDGALAGAELDGLALWHDANANGISDPGETRPVSFHGIVSIGCKGTAHPDTRRCAAWNPIGVTFADGSIRPTFDLILNRR